MWQGKSALVAGGSGLVGVNLVARLRNLGCSVRATFHNRKPPVVFDDVDYVHIDLLCRESIDAVVSNMDYAFLTAASTSGAAAISSTPMIHVTPNVLINSQFLESCYNAGVRKVMWLSSTTGYPDSPENMIEDDMFIGDPYEKYYFVGWMKRFTEILCNMYSNKLSKKMPSVVLRPSNIYGAYDKFDPERSHVLPALIRKVVERQDPIEVWGDGQDERDLIYVDDMIDAMILAMERIDTYDPINIGFGKTYTVNEVLKIIMNADGYDAEIVYNANKPTMIPVRKISIEKAKNLLNFEAKVSLEDGIKRTIEFYRSNIYEHIYS